MLSTLNLLANKTWSDFMLCFVVSVGFVVVLGYLGVLFGVCVGSLFWLFVFCMKDSRLNKLIKNGV